MKNKSGKDSDEDDIIFGNAKDNTLRGSKDDEAFRGKGGDDDINGRGGDDTLEGNAGEDTLTGGGGSDDIDGGSGNDSVNGGNGRDTISGGKGDDTLTGGKGADNFVFEPGDGCDEITDFEAGKDKLDLLGGNFVSAVFREVRINKKGNIKEGEGDVVVELFDEDDNIVLVKLRDVDIDEIIGAYKDDDLFAGDPSSNPSTFFISSKSEETRSMSMEASNDDFF